MNSLVIDASLTAAWFFDDEGDPRADAALNFVEEAGAFVPQLWHLEIRNVLLVAERRGRISPDQARDRLNSLRRLPIRTDAEPDLDSALDLARAYGLSFGVWSVIL
jgi:predicted nucleic acid-binding protein